MKKNVLEAVNNAENTMKLPPAELFEDVYAQMPKSLKVCFCIYSKYSIKCFYFLATEKNT